MTTPRQVIADDFARVIDQVQNPHSMNAWSERIEAQTLERLAARVDKQLERMEHLLADARTRKDCP